MTLVRIKNEDLPVGVPLPWPIYGKNGSMLLNSGCLIPSGDAAELLKVGLYRQVQGSDHRAERDITQRKSGLKPELPGLASNVERVQIALLEEGNRERTSFQVGFLGLIPDISVIVEHPQREGRLVPVGGGQIVGVNMLIERHVHVFASQVLCVQKHPVPYLHLAYPDAIKSSLLRSTRRVRLRHRILGLLQVGEDLAVPVSIVDLSGSGLGLISEYELGETGQSVSLSFTLTVAQKACPLRVEALIRSVRPLKAQKVYRYGVELLGLGEEQRAIIDSFLYEQR